MENCSGVQLSGLPDISLPVLEWTLPALSTEAQQGDPGKGWFTKFGELFEKNYNGGVAYDGDAWYGTNFIGPGKTANPYQLDDPKNPGKFLKPKDMVDAAAQRHDAAYWALGADGVTGAIFNTKVGFADYVLAMEAYQAFYRVFSKARRIQLRVMLYHHEPEIWLLIFSSLLV